MAIRTIAPTTGTGIHGITWAIRIIAMVGRDTAGVVTMDTGGATGNGTGADPN